jgi:hypothetical protein
LKWVVAYRSVEETVWEMNLSFTWPTSHTHMYLKWSPTVIITTP